MSCTHGYADFLPILIHFFVKGKSRANISFEHTTRYTKKLKKNAVSYINNVSLVIIEIGHEE